MAACEAFRRPGFGHWFPTQSHYGNFARSAIVRTAPAGRFRRFTPRMKKAPPAGRAAREAPPGAPRARAGRARPNARPAPPDAPAGQPRRADSTSGSRPLARSSRPLVGPRTALNHLRPSGRAPRTPASTTLVLDGRKPLRPRRDRRRPRPLPSAHVTIRAPWPSSGHPQGPPDSEPVAPPDATLAPRALAPRRARPLSGARLDRRRHSGPPCRRRRRGAIRNPTGPPVGPPRCARRRLFHTTGASLRSPAAEYWGLPRPPSRSTRSPAGAVGAGPPGAATQSRAAAPGGGATPACRANSTGQCAQKTLTSPARSRASSRKRARFASRAAWLAQRSR